jgi:hypothetical protein|tara:strand:- start:274 stop:522 length:249 start_codon:yes stop_codon:yes gene_type:complete
VSRVAAFEHAAWTDAKVADKKKACEGRRRRRSETWLLSHAAADVDSGRLAFRKEDEVIKESTRFHREAKGMLQYVPRGSGKG